ncbi:MAG: hypothetical protein G01um10143_51 [Parcubacteria group bacterium Gr01-1014_3]|nr:MAG: hypothetical protein G01um10143_51 [Parcubacteria group bacterium Gr01-1014_3]
MKENTGREGWDPVLAQLIDESQDLPSVRLEELQADQMLTIRTQGNMTIYLTMVDPQNLRVVLGVTGDVQLEPTEALFYGSSWGSPMVKLGLLVIGMRPVFTIRGRQFMTPEVISVQIKNSPRIVADLVGVAQWREQQQMRTIAQIAKALWAWTKRFWRGQ